LIVEQIHAPERPQQCHGPAHPRSAL